MTLAEIATYCTSKLGITDSATVALSKTFTKARWQMLWNAADWNQARMQQSLTVAIGTQDVTLDSNFEFATSARWAGAYELMPVNDLNAMATNPVGYDQAGPVAAFARLPKDSSGNARIRLFGIPAQEKTLLVIGKAKCPALATDSDSPTIIGADETLCAYTMGDLYQWLRQISKAQAFYQEANALSARMMEIETAQAPDNRRIIPVEQMLDDEGPSLW